MSVLTVHASPGGESSAGSQSLSSRINSSQTQTRKPEEVGNVHPEIKSLDFCKLIFHPVKDDVADIFKTIYWRAQFVTMPPSGATPPIVAQTTTEGSQAQVRQNTETYTSSQTPCETSLGVTNCAGIQSYCCPVIFGSLLAASTATCVFACVNGEGGGADCCPSGGEISGPSSGNGNTYICYNSHSSSSCCEFQDPCMRPAVEASAFSSGLISIFIVVDAIVKGGFSLYAAPVIGSSFCCALTVYAGSVMRDSIKEGRQRDVSQQIPVDAPQPEQMYR